MIEIDPRDKDYAFDIFDMASKGTLTYDFVETYFDQHRQEILAEVVDIINTNEPASHSLQHMQWDDDIISIQDMMR